MTRYSSFAQRTPAESPVAALAVCFDDAMAHDLIHPPKARPGERIAVLSPSFAAAGAFPAVHEQAMRRLTEVTGALPGRIPDDAPGGGDAAGAGH